MGADGGVQLPASPCSPVQLSPRRSTSVRSRSRRGRPTCRGGSARSPRAPEPVPPTTCSAQHSHVHILQKPVRRLRMKTAPPPPRRCCCWGVPGGNPRAEPPAGRSAVAEQHLESRRVIRRQDRCWDLGRSGTPARLSGNLDQRSLVLVQPGRRKRDSNVPVSACGSVT